MSEGHVGSLKGDYKSFVIPGLAKADIYSYGDQVKLPIKVFMAVQLKEMQPAKVIITLCVTPVKLYITLGPEGVKDPQDVGGNTSDNYIRVEMPFNSLSFLRVVIWKS